MTLDPGARTVVPDNLRAALADRYALERELGRGGMATVYLAHDLKHDRKVALKVLRPELAAALGAERFLAEIRVTAKGQTANGKSLLDLAILAAECGTALDIQAQGPDAEDAVSALAALIAAGLDAGGPESMGGEPRGQG